MAAQLAGSSVFRPPCWSHSWQLLRFDVTVWYGVCAPAGVPKAIASKIAADVDQALKDPAVVKRMAELGLDIDYKGPEEFARYVRAETLRWAKVVKTAGIQGQ